MVISKISFKAVYAISTISAVNYSAYGIIHQFHLMVGKQSADGLTANVY